MKIGVTISVASPDSGAVKVMHSVAHDGDESATDFVPVALLQGGDQFATSVDERSCLLLMQEDPAPRGGGEAAAADEPALAVIGGGDPAQPPLEPA
jgi:hypothetical protein